MFEWLRRKRPDKLGFVKFSAKELEEPLGIAEELEFDALSQGITPHVREFSRPDFTSVEFPIIHDGDKTYYVKKRYPADKSPSFEVGYAQGDPPTEGVLFTFLATKNENRWYVLRQEGHGTNISHNPDNPNDMPEESAGLLRKYQELFNRTEES